VKNLGQPIGLVAPAAARSWGYFFRGQWIQLLFLVAMLPAAAALSVPAVKDRHWLGLSNTDWFWVCVVAAIVHQAYVWLAWRSQLGWQAFTRVFGPNDFAAYCAVFFPLLAARPLLIFVVAWVDRESLALPEWIAIVCGSLLLVPALATGYSIQRYSGWARAAGADHFREAYRRMPLVKQGAFRWTDNAMYTLAFSGLWSIAFLLQSRLALVAAIFQHGYIWAHYLATEKPDMNLLYSRNDA